MPTPPNQRIPPVRKVEPTPRPKIVPPTSLGDALKSTAPQIHEALKSLLIQQLCAAKGSADAADVAIIAKELQKLPLATLRAFKAAGGRIVVCRGSVTDYRPDLKGVVPRGWQSGRTWDSVPGLRDPAKNEVIIAVIGHGTEAGPHYPLTGEGHESANLLVHEMFHQIDAGTDPPRGQGADFNRARGLDVTELSEYELQESEREVCVPPASDHSRLSDGETAGQQETYAESAARFFAGDSSSDSYPHLHEYWESNTLAPRDESHASGVPLDTQSQPTPSHLGTEGGKR
jgi:hypothetical protein